MAAHLIKIYGKKNAKVTKTAKPKVTKAARPAQKAYLRKLTDSPDPALRETARGLLAKG